MLDAARLEQNERILLHLECQRLDEIAADVVYHRSCYVDFTRETSLQQFSDLPGEYRCLLTGILMLIFWSGSYYLVWAENNPHAEVARAVWSLSCSAR